jgi:hypothetical protein
VKKDGALQFGVAMEFDVAMQFDVAVGAIMVDVKGRLFMGEGGSTKLWEEETGLLVGYPPAAEIG